MGPVWTLLLLHFAQAETRDAEGLCDARVNNALCYGALGGTIKIQLMDSGSTTHRCIWKHNDRTVFDWKDNTVKRNEFKNRSVFNSSTGIIQIQNLTKIDNDSYSLEFYNQKAERTFKSYHKLIIEAPVSSVLLEQECVSKGTVRASCTPQGGDSPEYIWTLNGQTLTDSELLSKNKQNTIVTLRQNTVGLLRCSVKNHISQEFKEIHINSCGYIFINCTLNGTQISDWVYKANNTLCIEQTTAAPITSVGKTTTTHHSVPASSPSTPAGSWYIQYGPIIGGLLVAALVFGVAIFCVLKYKKKRDQEHDQEVTYADVRILKQPRRRPQQPASEGEVEYGQVKFSNQNPHISVAEDNACIYAKVRR
ncbi:uncharacterized protein LOC117377233 isoform X1 [Periophthalmus magnuspinnatus]|uniref:uncharacterized protein LOC117377233 isoform X1 n=1 Tax=Periophthalmus magnuspinnatus TaxID=409849 RepID=UPI00145BC827|nr:uncharacterized protein LOC117377233 isoform X1 [Periophthalmus magnuspinnatus]